MSSHSTYDSAIVYLASRPCVCRESIDLVSSLFNVDFAIIENDIALAKRQKYIVVKGIKK
jgi:hypothetical protein